MLRETKLLYGSTLHAIDGEIGSVTEILFDDEHWTVRYLVVNTGVWLFGRKVLISPLALSQPQWSPLRLNVSLTRKEIEDSPGVDAHLPVSRQWEARHFGYYGWPYYWSGMGLWGSYWYPSALLTRPIDGVNPTSVTHDDTHLRSIGEVTGYGVSVSDGHIGHMSDFILDDQTWQIRYFVVNTGEWLPGKRVLLPPDWIGRVSWQDQAVCMNVTRDQVRNAPEWNSDIPITHLFEQMLYTYYERQGPVQPPPFTVKEVVEEIPMF